MTDRRRVQRIHARWTVALWNPRDGAFTSTRTENLSCDGFFCFTVDPYSVGDELQASLKVPALGLKDRRGATSFVLHCQVEVLRVTDVGGQYGIACRIKEDSVVGNRPTTGSMR